MTAFRHHARFAGLCLPQSQQRCVVMREVLASREDVATHPIFTRTVGTANPVVISVWNKKTGAGNQN